MKKATFCFRPFSPLLAETRKFRRCCEQFFLSFVAPPRPSEEGGGGFFKKKLHFVLICQLPCVSCTYGLHWGLYLAGERQENL